MKAHFFCAFAASAIALSLHGVTDVNFPDADGSHEICSPAAWGGAFPYDPTEMRPCITDGSVVNYTYGNNLLGGVPFAGLKFWNAGSVCLKYVSATTVTNSYNYDFMSGGSFTIDGSEIADGTVCIQGLFLPMNPWNSNKRKNTSICITNGTRVVSTANGSNVIGYFNGSGDNSVIVTDRSTLDLAGKLKLQMHKDGGSRLVVSDHSAFYARAGFSVSESSSSVYPTKPSALVVDNHSVAYLGGAPVLACVKGDSVTVRNHSAITNIGSYATFGTTGLGCARMVVDDSSAKLGPIYNCGPSNEMVFADSSVSIGILTIQPNSSLDFVSSNSVVAIDQIAINSTSNRFTFVGPRAKTASSSPLSLFSNETTVRFDFNGFLAADISSYQPVKSAWVNTDFTSHVEIKNIDVLRQAMASGFVPSVAITLISASIGVPSAEGYYDNMRDMVARWNEENGFSAEDSVARLSVNGSKDVILTVTSPVGTRIRFK